MTNAVARAGEGNDLEGRGLVIRLSIPARQALGRLVLPLLIAAACVLLLLGRADTGLTERARAALGDTLAPLYGVLAAPLARVHDGLDNALHLFSLVGDNARLRAENERLRQWQAVALTLEAENAELRADLHWIPDPAAAYVTARVVADAGGVYARSVLLSVGPNHSVARGEVALDDHGIVGRVTELGTRSARVLLITDINSRIPVTLEQSGGRAILAGTNGDLPKLLYWPEESPPLEGERVVTSAEAKAFPAGLPVGVVHYAGPHQPEVIPAARLERLDIVRLFDYRLGGVPPPETDARRLSPRPAGAPP